MNGLSCMIQQRNAGSAREPKNLHLGFVTRLHRLTCINNVEDYGSLDDGLEQSAFVDEKAIITVTLHELAE